MFSRGDIAVNDANLEDVREWQAATAMKMV